MPPPGVKGYLQVQAVEASARNQANVVTWPVDANSGTFEAFVKVELRGGERNVKAQTSKAPLINDSITWRENLKLEVLEGGNELRIMLCREKFTGVPAKKGTSVIAACGIFVNDIIDAVPIDKYFELFKPNAGGEGGFIRIQLNFAKEEADLDVNGTRPNLVTLAEDGPVVAARGNGPVSSSGAKRWRPLLLLPLLLLAGGGAALAVVKTRKRKGKQ